MSTTSVARPVGDHPPVGDADLAGEQQGGERPERREATDAVLTVVPRRNPWTWVGVAGVAVLVAMFVNGLATNPGWDWPTFTRYFATETVMRALGTTIQLTLLGTVAGFALGLVLAAMRLSHNAFLRTVAWAYIWAFRSIPLIVQLLFLSLIHI